MSNNKERWVIKAGSSLVTGEQEGINELFIKNLVSQVHELIKNNIVTKIQKTHYFLYFLMRSKRLRKLFV